MKLKDCFELLCSNKMDSLVQKRNEMKKWSSVSCKLRTADRTLGGT